jgi:hypothetical protein
LLSLTYRFDISEWTQPSRPQEYNFDRDGKPQFSQGAMSQFRVSPQVLECLVTHPRLSVFTSTTIEWGNFSTLLSSAHTATLLGRQGSLTHMSP